ncbi:MAG: penicillin-binding protein [Ruminococcaceae bacterium]|nr:penicillin-binding protein [Oscillospiraceae bacterium]
MKKVKNRSFSALIIAFAVIFGMVFYTVRYASDGEDWATFTADSQIVTNEGKLISGTVLDRNGVLLAKADNSKQDYSDDLLTRISTLHAVGDFPGNIGTGALSVFAEHLSGYNPITGITGEGGTVKLSIDSRINTVAYEAMAGRKGAVLISNYHTGEILCMVSAPSYDPLEGFDSSDPAYSGAYLNRCISSAFTPGSVFKLVTTAAALEQIDDIYSRRFTCEGQSFVDGSVINCTGTHGEQTIEQALANSCNCAFAELSLLLGGDTLEKYASDYGFTSSHSLNGIDTKKGRFESFDDATPGLAWSGIGQATDLVCPYSMLRFTSAIANGGTLVEGSLILNETGKMSTLIAPDTAHTLAEMMSYNVHTAYGTWLFPGLDMCAKSGTAEVGDGSSHSWFTGFITNEGHPYAFTVIIENAGGGLRNAGAVANTVLQALVTTHME